MPPVYNSSVVHSGNPTTAPAATLAATAVGDILIATVVNAGATTVPTLGGTYTGSWTLIDSGTWTTGAGATYWSRCTGNHTGQTVTATTVDSGSLAVHRITGAVATGSPISGSTGASVAAANGALSAFTTLDADTLVCLTVAVDDNQAYSAPTKNSVAMTARTSASSTGGGDSLVGLATLDQATAGSTGAFAITQAAGTAQGKRLTAFAIKPAPQPLIGDLIDDFDTNGTPDSTKWPSQGGSPTRAGGVLQAPGSAAGADYTWVQSASAYRAIGSETIVQLVTRPSSFNGNVDFLVRANTSNEWSVTIGSGASPGIIFRERVAGTLSDTSVTWNPATMSWFKIAVASDSTVSWHTSPSGEPGTWTQQRSKASGYTPTDTMQQVLQIQTFGANEGTVEWDNFNNPPAASTPIAGTETYTFADTSVLAPSTSVSETLGLTESASVDTGTAPSAEYGSATYETGFYSTGTSVSKSASDSSTASEATTQLTSLQAPFETFSFADALTVVITETRAASDGLVIADLSSIAATLSRVDAWTFVEALNLLTTEGKAGVDAWTLAEALSLLVTEGRAAVESFGLSESTSTSSNLSRVDAWTFVEALSLLITDTKAASESHGTNEGAALAVSMTPSDAWSLADVLSRDVGVLTTDASSLADSSLLATSLSAVDALIWTDSSTLSALFSVIDVYTWNETLAIAAAQGVADSLLLSDFATTSGNTFVVGIDAWTATDAATAIITSLALVASDALTLSDSSSLSAATSAVDSVVESALATLAAALQVTEALPLTDAATLLSTLSLQGADSTSVSESAILSGTLQLSRLDSWGLSDLSQLVASTDRVDSLTIADASSVVQSISKQASDALAMSGLLSASAALVGGDALALSDLGSLAAQQSIAAFDNLVWLAEQSLVAVGWAEPDIDRPTRAAVVAWASAAVLKAIDLGAEVDLYEASVVLAGNIKGVSIAPSKTSVAINPNRTSVSVG